MPDEPAAALHRGRPRIAIVAAEPDQRVAQQVARALGDRFQITVLFLDLPVSSERFIEELKVAQACLVFVSPAIEQSRTFSGAIEMAILLNRKCGRPVMIPIWMGAFPQEGSPVYGLRRFQGVRWRDIEGTTGLLRELFSIVFEGDRTRPRTPRRETESELEELEPPGSPGTGTAPPGMREQPLWPWPFNWARRRIAGWRIEPTADLPEGRCVDDVNLSVTAPANLAAGQTHEIRFWAHLESQTDTVVARALAAMAVINPRKLFVKTEGPFRVARGASLEITVSIQDLAVLDASKAILWTGGIGCAAFLVNVPARCFVGPKAGTASVRIAGSEIARIGFLVQVGGGSARARRVRTGIKRHKTAFACYASEDRDAVLARIQGIHKAAPSLKVFTDVMSLRSGEDWERKLYQTIANSDVFYLFWCRHARQSEWVEKEWRCAFQAKGIDFIDPVPLESPAFAPPPRELSKKHFNEPILAYIGNGNHPPPKVATPA